MALYWSLLLRCGAVNNYKQFDNNTQVIDDNLKQRHRTETAYQHKQRITEQHLVATKQLNSTKSQFKYDTIPQKYFRHPV